MGVEYMARQIYQDVIARVTRTEADWKAVCRLAGQIYRYEFDNVLMVYAQRPSSTLVADYDTWKKVHRYVKPGSKGMAIFPSRALKPGLWYVFDISDTGGKECKADMGFGGGEPAGFAVGTVETGRDTGDAGNGQKKPDGAAKSLYKAGSARYSKRGFRETVCRSRHACRT